MLSSHLLVGLPISTRTCYLNHHNNLRLLHLFPQMSCCHVVSLYTWWTCHSCSGLLLPAVVLQYYELQVYYNRNVIRGNTAVLKCTIPSFVREYITVTSWVQDSKFNIYPTTKGGKLLLQHSILCQHYLFNHFIYPPSTCQELPPQAIFLVTRSDVNVADTVFYLRFEADSRWICHIASLITARNSIKPAIIFHAFM